MEDLITRGFLYPTESVTEESREAGLKYNMNRVHHGKIVPATRRMIQEFIAKELQLRYMIPLERGSFENSWREGLSNPYCRRRHDTGRWDTD